MPHITLLYPFAPKEQFSNIIPKLVNASARVSSFHLTFRRFSHFRHRRSCTIFLVPEPEQRVKALCAVLTEAFPEYNDTSQYPGGYHPHLSVGQFRANKVLQEQRILQSGWNSIECDVTRVSLIYRSPETNERFVEANRFSLSK